MATDPILQSSARVAPRAGVRTSLAVRADWLSGLLSRLWLKRLVLVSADLAAIVASHHFSELLMQRSMHLPTEFLNPPDYYLFYAPFFLLLFALLGAYGNPDLRRPEKELELLFKGVSFSFIALACANFVLFKSLGFSRYLLLGWYALALAFVLAERFAVRGFYAELWRRGFARHEALLFGAPDQLADFRTRLAIQRYRGYSIAGVLVDPEEPLSSDAGPFAWPVLGSIDDWERGLVATNAQLAIFYLSASSPETEARIERIIRRCQQQGIEIEVYSHFFRSGDIRLLRDEFSGCFRVESAPRWSQELQHAAKAVLDVLAGLVGSAVTLALIPALGLLIKCEDGGPIFHRREYLGTDGRIHHFLKFRTMVENAEEILKNDPALKARFARNLKLPDDPRVLRSGRLLRKYSLDEFPQFFSVLAGSITLVGPRAITPEARERYGDCAAKLLSVKPGLTGFWQVMGRQTTTYEEKIQMDMFYIDHWSIWLDLVIVAKTVWQVFRAEGAY
jgi:exopolysaccharide biosynthesis polyprenyl glycosylphosphotransferase